MLATTEDREPRAGVPRSDDALFENNPFAMFLIGKGGELARVNAAFRRVTGLSADELCGRSLEDLVSRRDVHELYDYHREKLRHRDRTFEYECSIVHRDGHDIRVVITMNIVVEAGYGLGALRDVTEERRLSSEVQARNAELEQTASLLRAAQEELHAATQLATLGEVSGRVAHELLNPLTAVTARLARVESVVDQLTELATCIRGTLPDVGGASAPILAAVADVLDEQRQGSRIDLDLMASELRRIARLVQDMRGAMQPASDRARVDLGEVLHYCGEVMAGIIERSATAYRWSCPDHVQVDIDHGEIVQALTNLIRNATEAHDALPPGAVKQLTMTVEATADVATIRVADTGAGVDDAHAALIFEPRFTTKPSGTGLGLAISRRLVRAHGGDLVLVRPAGGGATFVVTLPCTRALPPSWSG